MTASATISREDFEKIRGRLATQWSTSFPGKVQPFEVIFNETSKENSTSAQMGVAGSRPPHHANGGTQSSGVATQQQTTNRIRTGIRTSTNDLTKRLRPNHTEG